MVDLSTKLNNVNYHNDNHNDDNNNDEDEDEITDIQNHHQSANEQEESNVRMLSSRCDRIDFIDGIPIHHHRDHSNIDESNGEEYCKLSFCT